MRTLDLKYACNAETLAPAYLRATELWSIAENARQQFCFQPRRPKLDVAHLASRLRQVTVNGIAMQVQWELSGSVTDSYGAAVLGSTEASGDATVLVRLNADLIGDNDELARSTALHELGHVVFDAPAWFASVQTQLQPSVRLHSMPDAVVLDWPEWRANEFMGGFLTPRTLLHRELVRHASMVGVKLTQGRFNNDLPIIAPFSDSIGIQVLIDRLADMFGLSCSFIAVRLTKYGLLSREHQV
jgi:hypothetical protein